MDICMHAPREIDVAKPADEEAYGMRQRHLTGHTLSPMNLSYARGCVRGCGCGRACAATDSAMPAGKVAYGVRQVDTPGRTQKNGSGNLAGDAADGGEEWRKDDGEECVGLVVDRAYVQGDEVC